MKRIEFREGKTKGNTKPLPKGPRPNIGPPPPQYPKKQDVGEKRLTILLYIA